MRVPWFQAIGSTIKELVSTARPQAGYPLGLEWTLPSTPLIVRLSRDALSRIQAAVLRSRAMRPHSCPGGFLLGTCDRVSSWQISIENTTALEWDSSRGGAPFLTEAQNQTLRERLSSLPPDSVVVGSYRTSRAIEFENPDKSVSGVQGGRALPEADRRLLATCCPLSAVSLGLRLDLPNLEPRVFVLWQDANVYELVPNLPNVPSPSPDPLHETQEAVQPQAPEQRPVALLQASTRAERHVSLVSAPASNASSPLRPTSLPRLATWVLGTVLVSLLTYVGAHLYLKPTFLRLATQTHSEWSSDARDSVAAPAAALGLRVNQNGTALELAWDTLSAAMRPARSARLLIMDGALVRQIDLDRDQLRSGRIVYTPVVGDVTFRLEVADSESHSVTESIRVLDGSLSAISSGNRQLMGVGNPPPVNGNANNRLSSREERSGLARPIHASAQNSAPAPAVPDAGSRPRSPPKPTASTLLAADNRVVDHAQSRTISVANPPHSAIPEQAASSEGSQRLSEDSAQKAFEDRSASLSNHDVVRDLIERSQVPALLQPWPASSSVALSVLRAPNSAAKEHLEAEHQQSQLPDTAHPSFAKQLVGATGSKLAEGARLEIVQPPSPLPPSLDSKPGPTNMPDGKTTASYAPPRPIKKVMPDMRLLGSFLVYETDQVEVQVTIDLHGRVTDARAVRDRTKPNSLAVSAAVTAAKQWVFQPAMSHGKTVPANHTIFFKFRPKPQ